MQEPPRPPAIFQKIIVATDFSEFAGVALLRAANLALRFQASIVIAYVIDPISSAAGSEGVPFVEQEDEHSALQKLEAASLCLRECGIPYSLAVRKGDIRDELSRLVEEEQADLLVLSTHGRYRFDRPVCSSIAEKILRMAPCPVMTVGPAAWLTRDAAYNSNHILFPTDLSPVSLRVLPFVDSIASLLGAQLTMLLVLTEGLVQHSSHGALARLEDVVHKEISLTKDVRCITQSGELGEAIASAALSRNCDFIVLGIHREDLAQSPRGGLHLGLVYQIVSRTATPVISLHNKLEIELLRATRIAGVSAHV
jgi:nucleotide-binding universal stress UspA family protein